MQESLSISELFQIVTRFSTVIAQLFIFIVCLSYLIRNNAIDSILLTIGSFLGVLTYAYGTFILPSLVQSLGIESMQFYIGLGSLIGFVGLIIFGIGLLMSINKFLRN